MKWHTTAAAIAVLCLGLFCSFPAMNNEAQAQSKAPAAQMITVLNPLGIPHL